MKPQQKPSLARAQPQALLVLAEAVGPKLKGLTPHPTALHYGTVTDFLIFASVPAAVVFSNASVFNFKDTLAEEALLPDDNLKIMMILLVLLMLAIV